MIKVNIEHKYNDKKGGFDILSDVNINGGNNNLKNRVMFTNIFIITIKDNRGRG